MTVVQSKSRGGARLNSGKRMPSGEKAIRRSITIDPCDESTLLDFGKGLSVGIRLAAKLVRDVKSSDVKNGYALVNVASLSKQTAFFKPSDSGTLGD